MKYSNDQPSMESGFTLVELLIATLVLLLAFVGVLVSYLKCMELSELSRNSSIAVEAVKNQMESINNTAFDQIFVTYNNVPFAVNGLNGMGVTYVDNSDPDFFEIRVTVCWRQKNGRIIGEDSNLNGQLNVGEDQNGNNMLDSIVQISTTKFNET
ncbi:MAG: prepilin-type N-terminal cleavage/methylation domain-containing protein [Candidatus Omnitrophica bacterium]|nr:prepilin-type N-terminal cleavage/methylation domain-containing protein [Candidatus Omnitrophota bacterium]